MDRWILHEETSAVCPKHSYSLGIYYRPPVTCKHPRHENIVKKSKSLKIRYAGYALSCQITKKYQCLFPLGSSICTKCRNREEKAAKKENKEEEFAFLYDHDDKSPDIDNSADKDLFTVEQESSLTTEEFNDLMVEAGIDDEGFTPIKYQIRSPVEDLSQNTKRAIKRKYKQAMKAFSKTLTHTICPGQNIEDIIQSESSSSEEEAGTNIDSNLLGMVKNAETRHLKALLISTKAENLSCRKIIKLFNVSRGIANLAKQLAGEENLTAELIIPKKSVRQKLDMLKVEHFYDFMFDSGFIQDVAYGTAVMELDSGKMIEIPKSVHQLQRRHIIHVYENFCKEQLYDPLSASSLWKIMDNCNTSERKAMQGLDDYTADGLTGFDRLHSVVNGLKLILKKRSFLN